MPVKYQPPPRARNDSETLTRYIAPYQDSAARPYIHLLDGGLTDNLGLRSLLDFADIHGDDNLQRQMPSERKTASLKLAVLY